MTNHRRLRNLALRSALALAAASAITVLGGCYPYLT